MRMSKVHIWVGSSSKSDKEFGKYFKLDDQNKDLDSPNYKICQFCLDLGLTTYDDDFIGVYKTEDIQKVSIFLEELSVSDTEYKKIDQLCLEKGFSKINAMFYYTDSELEIRDSEKKYNDLTYLGYFDTDF